MQLILIKYIQRNIFPEKCNKAEDILLFKIGDKSNRKLPSYQFTVAPVQIIQTVFRNHPANDYNFTGL